MKKHLHIVSTGRQTLKQFSEIASLIHNYVDAIHLREKNWTANELQNAVKVLSDKGVPLKKLVINDRVDVALTTGVGGVQLPQHSLNVSSVRSTFSDLKIGCSVHSLAEAIYAEKHGADYLFYGHIYQTPSKPGVAPKGLRKLQEITKHINVPTIAIGGIQPGNVADIVNAGAGGIAVLSGVLEDSDPLRSVKAYQSRLVIEEEKQDGKNA